MKLLISGMAFIYWAVIFVLYVVDVYTPDRIDIGFAFFFSALLFAFMFLTVLDAKDGE